MPCGPGHDLALSPEPRPLLENTIPYLCCTAEAKCVVSIWTFPQGSFIKNERMLYTKSYGLVITLLRYSLR